IKVVKHYRNNLLMYWGWIITLSFITLQVVFGALVIFTMLNLGVALLHALFITCYFGMLSYFILLSSRSAKFEKEMNTSTKKQKYHSVFKYTYIIKSSEKLLCII